MWSVKGTIHLHPRTFQVQGMSHTRSSPSTLLIVPSRRPAPWQALPPGMTVLPPTSAHTQPDLKGTPCQGLPPSVPAAAGQALCCQARSHPKGVLGAKPGLCDPWHRPGWPTDGDRPPSPPTTAVGSPICWPSSDCRASSSAVAPGSVRRSGCPRAATALTAAEPDGPGSQ